MIEIVPGTPDNLVFAIAHGTVTATDYELVLIPTLEEKLKDQKKVRLLYQLDTDFDGLTPGAMWDDTKLGLTHITGFDAIAIVTDVRWISESVKFLGFFLHFPVKVFANKDLADAREWVMTTTWRNLREPALH